MKDDRRYHLFNDYLRDRFAERLQRVTLSGGLVCTDPAGPEECAYCRAAAALDPGWGHGMPPHEQIRRGVNFSRRRGEQAPRLMVSVPAPLGACPPPDHLAATLSEAIAADNVALLSVWSRPDCLTPELVRTLAGFAEPGREVWLEVEGTPDEWPVERSSDLRFGVQVDLGAVPTVSRNGHGVAAADRVRRLRPDAVSLKAPAFIDGTADGALYESGELEEMPLEEFADRAAEFLERIPAGIAVHPIVFSGRSDQVLGPRWILNRQKVEEAVARALSARGTHQGQKAN